MDNVEVKWVCTCLLESLFSLLLDIFIKGPVAVLCLTLKNNLFSTVAASSFSFSPAMNYTSNFFTFLSKLFFFFNYSYLFRCDVVSHHGFDLHFPDG